MAKTYRIVFLGLIESRERFTEAMSKLGVTPDTVEEMILKAPVVIKGGLRLPGARQYADVIQNAGGRVAIREQGVDKDKRRVNRAAEIRPFGDFLMCPQCGHKQPRSETCMKCGFLLP